MRRRSRAVKYGARTVHSVPTKLQHPVAMHRLMSRFLAGLFAVSLFAASAWAQSAGPSAAAATGRTLLGATAGTVLGALAGGYIGAVVASRENVCHVGDPDGCLGATIPRALWGAGVGMTLATPLGAHLGNKRRGHLAYTAIASTAIFAGEIIALRSLIDDGRTEHKSTVIAIAVGIPVLQIIASTVTERAFPRAR
jgi:hypothetical protein